MGSQNNQRPGALSALTANDVAKLLSAIRKIIAFDAEPVASQFFFDKALDCRQVALAAKGASLADDHFQGPA
jgi:hypothetical protein